MSISQRHLDRRKFLGSTASRLNAVAIASILDRDGLLAATPSFDLTRPHAPRPPHLEARSKNVLMNFGASECRQLENLGL